jgi:hypothetical protein
VEAFCFFVAILFVCDLVVSILNKKKKKKCCSRSHKSLREKLAGTKANDDTGTLREEIERGAPGAEYKKSQMKSNVENEMVHEMKESGLSNGL